MFSLLCGFGGYYVIDHARGFYARLEFFHLARSLLVSNSRVIASVYEVFSLKAQKIDKLIMGDYSTTTVVKSSNFPPT